MLKKQFITDISAGEEVVDFFLVRTKKIGNTRTGKPYLDIELQDRTGILSAKVWDKADEYEPLFKRGDIIKIKAQAESYREQTQIRIYQLRPTTENETEHLDKLDFIPATEKDVAGMMVEMEEIIAGIANPHISRLIKSFFEDEKFKEQFRTSVAARDIHHAYLGGLLEHTLQVTKLAVACCNLYPDLDRDALVGMAILHDVGKIQELGSGAEIIYTTEGYLMGHISLGLQMLDERIRAIEDFPAELALRLKHILLSHHGELEFGSPIVPKTPEAMVLHYLDNLDAKTNLIFKAIARDKNVSEPFTQYHRVMERHFYKGKRKDDSGKD